MRRRLNITERRATSVGCAVKTGVTQMRPSSARASSARDAGEAHAAQRAAQGAALRAGVGIELAERRRRLRWLVSARLMSSK